MLTESNLPQLLTNLGFEKKANVYRKFFETALLEVNFDQRTISYPEANGLLVNERQTCNFEANENFVVLECVHRLLKKGYKPEHIELEPKWKLGRGASGGRADVLVKDNAGRPLLIIECKTAGTEFNRAWNKTLQDGDQLFSYAQQISETQFLCLYASDLDAGQVRYTSHVIAHRDNEKYLSENPDFKSFQSATNVKERFSVWRDTYRLDYATKGIFEANIQPYQIGKNKYGVEDLSPISASDQQKKYHEFATILRQHNVSGRENAFDKLVNLFLCKLVDEIENPHDLKFYWKGVAYDTHFDLMDRLQQLYQAGMGKFLGEDITYINQADVFNAMRFIRQDPDATQRAVWGLFIKQKFFTNSDFSLIDVHNQKLFYQNAEVLLKILQMWQDIRLTHSDGHNQFLGDMFEGFLDQGVKQSEGQYFTPMPICRFILMSLPLDSMVQHNGSPPKAIDYACGAGHFLTELALQLKPLVARHKSDASLSDYHRAIYGIEKEYRLSKVAKVSAFMYGQQEINICYGDALVNQHAAFPGIEDGSFDILVANPPYSVRGFLETLPEKERQAYKLADSINELETASSIEAFFIERAKQLLKTGGVAAIVLPSSILSNGNSIYVRAREILIQYFDIVAITEFGSGTFGKTGTNTVTLFLRRKPTAPDTAQHYRERVDEWFKGEAAGTPAAQVYQDGHVLQRYCTHIQVPLESYQTLLQGQIDGPWTGPLEGVYLEKFNASAEVATLHKAKWFKALDEAKQAAEIDKRYLAFVQAIERDKLYHFVMACDQKNPVLIIRSPTDTKEQKKFLGYEWSSAKGGEGIRIAKDASGHHLTPLYDEINRANPTKLNALIAANFDGNLSLIPQDLQAVVQKAELVELLDFSRPIFEKQITLSFHKGRKFKKWPSKILDSFLRKIIGSTLKVEESEIKNFGAIPVVTQSAASLFAGYVDTEEFITDLPVIAFGDHTCVFKYIDQPFVRGADGVQLISVDGLNLKYLFYFLTQVKIENSDKYERHFKYLKNENIPVPEKNIQEAIVRECEVIDEYVKSAFIDIKNLKKKIRNIIENISYPITSLIKIAKINPPKSELKSFFHDMLVSYVDMASVSESGVILNRDSRMLGTLRKGGYTYFAEDDILIAKITPCMENGKCALATGLENGIGMGSTEFHVIRADKERVLPAFLFKLLNREEIRQRAAQVMTGSSGHRRVPASFYESLEVPLPPLSEQSVLVAQFEALEKQIADAQSVIDCAAARKQAILEKYL